MTDRDEKDDMVRVPKKVRLVVVVQGREKVNLYTFIFFQFSKELILITDDLIMHS